MTDNLSGLFAVLIFITVALTALSIGLLTSWTALRDTVRGRTFGLVVLANVVVVPLVGWALVASVDLSPNTATGILLCSICAAGPVALKASQIARGDLVWALSLTVILLMVNVISLPVWSWLLLDQTMALGLSDLLGVLVLAIVVPVLIGVWTARRSSDAHRWSSYATGISNVTLVLAVAVGVVGSLEELGAALTSPAFAVSLAIVVIAGVIGLLVSGATSRGRASSLVTLNRATSVALLVVGRAFPEATEVFTAVVVFGLVQTAAALVLSSYWRWIRSASPTPVPVSEAE